MFSTLRIAAVVGVIYSSPVRHEDAKAGVEHVVAWGKGLVAPSREASSAERVEALGKALPDDAKQAAIDRMLSEAGASFRAGRATWRGLRAPRRPRAPSRPATGRFLGAAGRDPSGPATSRGQAAERPSAARGAWPTGPPAKRPKP